MELHEGCDGIINGRQLDKGHLPVLREKLKCLKQKTFSYLPQPFSPSISGSEIWIDWVWLFAKTCILIYAFAFMIYELNQISRTKNGPNSKLNWMLLFLFWNPRQTTAGPWDSSLGSVNTDQLLTVTERIWLGISGSNVDGRNEVVEQIILCSVHQICIRAKLTTGGVRWREILLG